MSRNRGALRAGARPARRAGARAALLLTATALLTPTLPALAGTATTGATAAVTDGALAFDLPATSSLRASSRKAFAHYLTAFPQSIDNAPEASDYYTTQYLNPNGESGKHAAYGGFVRDRPLGRAPLSDSAWQLRDMETDVRQAVAAGLDGFSMDLLQLGDSNGTHWQRAQLLLQAAQNVDPGFKIMLMPDMAGLGDKDPATLARYVAQLGQSPSAYRLDDGRLVVSPFYTEAHGADWWKQFLSIMQSTHGTPVAFLPLFLNEQPNVDAFAPISYGMSNWGNRNPAGNDPTTTYATSPAGRIARVHALGQKWMAPVSVQDERPNQGLFDEAENTTNLRNTWQIALQNNAELVQLPTWNDYAEGAHVGPSAKHGWAYLDVSAYYMTKWKTGAAPAVQRDTVYLTHRTQPAAALPSFPETRLMTLRGGSSPARDTVEALTFLTAPSTVEVTVGGRTSSCQAPAGPGVCTVPLSPGTVSVRVLRGGVATTAVTSPFPVTATPYVQDLQYTAVSSGRSGTRAALPAADATAPSAPGAPGTSVSATTVSLSWPAATDAVGVVGYEVHRSATDGFVPGPGTLVGTTTGTSFSETLAPGTVYYRVVAKDAAGNVGAPSGQAAATVAAPAPSPSPSPTAAPAPSPAPAPSTSPSPVGTTSGTLSGTGTTLAPLSDSYAHEWAAGTNFGTSASLDAQSGPNVVSYLRFAIPTAPKNKRLVGASLRLRTNTSAYAGSTGAVDVRAASNYWSESALTWQNRPTVTGTLLGQLRGATAPNTPYVAPLSATGVGALAGQQVTFALTSTSTDDLWLWSSNHPNSSYRPALVLTYG